MKRDVRFSVADRHTDGLASGGVSDARPTSPQQLGAPPPEERDVADASSDAVSSDNYQFDIAANRSARKWSRRELIGRAVWEALRGPLFAWTPRPMWAWRRCILRLFGAKVGREVHIYPSVRITVPWNLQIGDEAAIGDRAVIYSLGVITIGPRATVSHQAHLCAGTHDYRQAEMTLLRPPIAVGEGAWICADAFVGPGVTIGDFSIVGARAVVVKNIPQAVIVGGNPARVLRPRPCTMNK